MLARIPEETIGPRGTYSEVVLQQIFWRLFVVFLLCLSGKRESEVTVGNAYEP
jgi:hypothetical protein